MKASGEAQCPMPKYVQDANNTESINDVFFNICGLVDGSWWEFAKVKYIRCPIVTAIEEKKIFQLIDWLLCCRWTK